MRKYFAIAAMAAAMPFAVHAQEKADKPVKVNFDFHLPDSQQLPDGYVQLKGSAKIGSEETEFLLSCGYNETGLPDPSFEQLEFVKQDSPVYQVTDNDLLVMYPDPDNEKNTILRLFPSTGAEITKKCDIGDRIDIPACDDVEAAKIPKEKLQNPLEQIKEACRLGMHRIASLIDPRKFEAAKTDQIRNGYRRVINQLKQ